MAQTTLSTTIEITGCDITENEIILTGVDLDGILMDFNLDDELQEVSFSFSKENKGALKYLIKVVSNNNDGKSFKDKLEKMTGKIVTLSDSFKQKKGKA